MSSVKTIGIIGSGQMGRGIAQVAAMSGFQCLMFDISQEGLKKGMSFIEKQLLRGIEKKKWDEAFTKKTLSNLKSVSELVDLKDCDLIIEAATENKQIKFKIFKDLDSVAKKEAILASNTSSISITEIASQTQRPEQVVGMHFMNPVPVMKLVEGIRGVATSDESFNTIRNVSKEMGKTFVAVNDFPGFAVNRILMPMINEAVYVLYEGVASAEDIDTAMKLGTNQPMGPLALADFIGLDTCLAIMEVLYNGLSDSKYRPCPLLKKYVLAGWFGKKSGKGFYQYE